MERLRCRGTRDGRARLYAHATLPGVYELLPARDGRPFPELAQSAHFLEHVELVAVDASLRAQCREAAESDCEYLAVVPYQGRDLDLVRADNEHIEETYISIIMRTVVDALTWLHSNSIYGIDMQLRGWRLLPCGALKAKDCFRLNRDSANAANDIVGFKAFTAALCRVENWGEGESGISSLFRQFLAAVAQLANDNVGAFSTLRENRFLKKNANNAILVDLLEAQTSESLSSLKDNDSNRALSSKKSLSPINNRESVEEERIAITKRVFDKYIENEKKSANKNSANILQIISANLLFLYKTKPERAQKFVNFYLK